MTTGDLDIEHGTNKPPSKAVTVKPLEWERGMFRPSDGLTYTSRAFSPIGTYYASERTWYGPGVVVAHGADESDCQKWADENHTRIILSALTAAQPSVEEAARVLLDAVTYRSGEQISTAMNRKGLLDGVGQASIYSMFVDALRALSGGKP